MYAIPGDSRLENSTDVVTSKCEDIGVGPEPVSQQFREGFEDEYLGTSRAP